MIIHLSHVLGVSLEASTEVRSRQTCTADMRCGGMYLCNKTSSYTCTKSASTYLVQGGLCYCKT
jgi:hypothetical protein